MKTRARRNDLRAEAELVRDLISHLEDAIWQVDWWIRNSGKSDEEIFGGTPEKDRPEALFHQRKNVAANDL